MNLKRWPLLTLLAVVAAEARAQESMRDLDGPGLHSKFLTANQVDRWLFDGDKGETLIAHVASKEFDPILELAQAGDKEKPLLEVDDPGNESRFSIRLPEKGKYEIRVHAFKYQGGGNYQLWVERFRAGPLAIGKPSIAAFDRAGKSYHFFQGVKDQVLIPELKGMSAQNWKVLDFKGRAVGSWAGSVLIEETGDYYLIVSGNRDDRAELVLREARRFDLTEGKEMAGSLQAGEMAVWSFSGKPGDFRFLELEKKGEVASRLIAAPLARNNDQRLPGPNDRPELTSIPVASRGGRLRYAAILGAESRYQFQLVAQTLTSYKLTMRDPSEAIAWGKEIDGTLPVSGARFCTFRATPGQLLQASLASRNFVPLLRLYDAQGNLVASSSEESDTQEGRLSHMVLTGGPYRLQVSSRGDGGGGEFRLALKEIKLKELRMGDRVQGSVPPGVVDFWAFNGKEGQIIFLNVRSTSFEPVVSLHSPDGIVLAADNKGSDVTGSLFAVKLPRSGRYTVWITPQRGSGDYTVRLIDGE